MIPKIELIKSTPCLVIDLGIDDYTITRQLLEYIQLSLSNIKDVKAVILKGSEEVFCRGLNIKSIVTHQSSCDEIREYLVLFQKVLLQINQCPIPVLAKIEGDVLGGGLGIACAADVLLMSNTAKISLPETIIGMVPAMIFPFIVKRLSVFKAKSLTITTMSLSATEAFNLGLVDEIADDMNITLKKYINRLSKIDAVACAEFKMLCSRHYSVYDDAYLAEAMELFIKLATSEDTKRRMAEFLGGSSPW